MLNHPLVFRVSSSNDTNPCPTAATEDASQVVTWAELTSAGFEAGNDVLIQVVRKLRYDSNSAYVRSHVAFGTTFAGRVIDTKSAISFEPPSPNYRYVTFNWFVRRTLVNNENLYFPVWGSSALSLGYDIEVQVIRLSDLDTGSYLYAEVAHSGNAGTTYGVTGASVTIPASNEGDWAVMATSSWLDDSASATAFLDITIDGTARSEVKFEGEDTENTWTLSTGYYAPGLSVGNVLQARYRSGTASTHDCTRTAIFALRLDNFAWHTGGNTLNTVSFNSAYTNVELLSLASFDLGVNRGPIGSLSAFKLVTAENTKDYSVDTKLYIPSWTIPGHNGEAFQFCNLHNLQANGAADVCCAPNGFGWLSSETWYADILAAAPGLAWDLVRYPSYIVTVYVDDDVAPVATSTQQSYAVWSWLAPPVDQDLYPPSLGDLAEIGSHVFGEIIEVTGGEYAEYGNAVANPDRLLTQSGQDYSLIGLAIRKTKFTQVGDEVVSLPTDTHDSDLLLGVLKVKREVSEGPDRSDLATNDSTIEPVEGDLGLDPARSYKVTYSVNGGRPPLIKERISYGDYDELMFTVSYAVNPFVPQAGRLTLSSLDQNYDQAPTEILYDFMSLDMEYVLYSYVPVFGELGQGYSLLTIQLAECELDQSWSQRLVLKELSLDQTYDTLTESGAIPQMEFSMEYQQHSSRWLTEILALVNQERAAAGRTHSISLYEDYSFINDMSSIHSRNMSEVGVYAHNSVEFPEGMGTLPERAQYINHQIGVRENILIKFSSPTQEYIEFPLFEPEDAHLDWHDSPVHYDNYMYEWPPGAEVKMLVGIDAFGYYHEPPGVEMYYYSMVLTQLFVNIGKPENLMLNESSLNMKYEVAGAFIETYNMQWFTDAYNHVSSRNAQEFAIRVSSQIEEAFNYRLAVQNVQPVYSTIQVRHEQDYSQNIFVRSQGVGQPYDIFLNVKVASQVDQVYGDRVKTQVEQGYRDFSKPAAMSIQEYEQKPIVRAVNSQGYEPFLQRTVTNSQNYEERIVSRVSNSQVYDQLKRVLVSSSQWFDSPVLVVSHSQSFDLNYNTTIRGQLESLYSLMTGVKASVIENYGNRVLVKAQNAAEYELALLNRVMQTSKEFYSIAGADYTTNTAETLEVVINGDLIEVDEVSISMQEGEFVWHCQLSVPKIEDFVKFKNGDAFSVVINAADLGGEAWEFIVDNKAVTRSGYGEMTLTLEGFSPAIVLGPDYATPQDYVEETLRTASQIATDIAGLVLWDTMDWDIPPYRFGVRGVTAIEAISLLADAVGGVLESHPDGVLHVRPKYSVNVQDYYTSAVDHTFTDMEDNISTADDGVLSEERNRFRLLETAAVFTDSIVFIEDKYDKKKGVLKVYPSPWRESVSVVHTDGSDIGLSFVGNVLEDKEDLVEIKGGEGTLTSSLHSLVGFVWESESMGGIYVEKRTSRVTVEFPQLNSGYGLVRVKYKAESIDYEVVSEKPVGQFLVLDEGA